MQRTAYVLFWLPMTALAFLNAALRELVFRKYFSDSQATRMSTLTLAISCRIYASAIFRFLKLESSAQALTAGLYWTVLTVIFEFGLGALLRRPMRELPGQYDLAAGQTWPVFLIFLFLLPFLLYLFR